MVYHLLLASGVKKLAQSALGEAARSLMQESGLRHGSDWAHHILQKRATRREELGTIYHRIVGVHDAFAAPERGVSQESAASQNEAQGDETPGERVEKGERAENSAEKRREFVDLLFKIRHVGGKKYKTACQALLMLYEELCTLDQEDKEVSEGDLAALRKKELRREIARKAGEIASLVRKDLGL